MPKPVKVGKKERMSFGKITEVWPMPNLIDIQTKSYRWFLEEGLKEAFDDISPIRDYAGNLSLEFVDYSLEIPPKYDQEECKERESGSFNLPIVKDLLSVYFDYLDIMASVKPSDSPDGNHDKTVGMLISLFDDIEDILIRNGIEFVESAENSARSMFSSKVIQTIETDRKELHNCVVRSRRKGAVYGKQAPFPFAP